MTTDTTTSAVERIWTDGHNYWGNPTHKSDKTEYIRRDLYDALASDNARLKGQLEAGRGAYSQALNDQHQNRTARITAEAERDTALAHIDELGGVIATMERSNARMEASNHRAFPEAADGRPLPPMGDELMTAGLSGEDARFVAIQLAQNGLTLVPYTSQAERIEKLEAAIAQAAVPLEGLTLAAHMTGSNMGLCKGTWDEINNAVQHIRAAISDRRA